MDSIHIDFTELRTSWTKYDIVQALDVIYSVDTIQKYKKKSMKEFCVHFLVSTP